MQLAYHSKDENNGWVTEKVAPITDKDWTAQDYWAYDYLTKDDSDAGGVITMGWSMWSLVAEGTVAAGKKAVNS